MFSPFVEKAQQQERRRGKLDRFRPRKRVLVIIGIIIVVVVVVAWQSKGGDKYWMTPGKVRDRSQLWFTYYFFRTQ